MHTSAAARGIMRARLTAKRYSMQSQLHSSWSYTWAHSTALAMMVARIFTKLCLGFAALGLTGCGWHLQGSARLPASMMAIHIDTLDTYSDFYRELRASLVEAGAQVKTQADGAPAVVHIKADATGQRVSSISARNRPEQYDVYYRIEFSVELSGAEVIPAQQVELTATYSYDSNAVLAKQREQLTMQRSLARELADQVLRRLSSVSAQTANSRPASGPSTVGDSGTGT
jgi:LPS-assembly lipoprotein